MAAPARDRWYKYRPLEDAETEIRILRILPSGESDEIHCALETRSLTERPFYVALSYECGEPEPTIEIKVDGKALNIRFNLYLLLQHLILEKSNVLNADHFRLWVDAICIHQGDDAEKAVQVRNMGRIFQQADFVYTWLGYSTNFDTKKLFRFFLETNRRRREEGSAETWIKNFMTDSVQDNYFSVEKGSKTIWLGMNRLLQLSYWSRRWIIQEILLAREVVLLCDRDELHWTAMRGFLQTMSSPKVRQLARELDLGGISLDTILETSTPWKMHDYAVKLEDPESSSAISLKDLLSSFIASRCELSRDKILCLVNLLGNDFEIHVDYECSLFTLFSRLITPEVGIPLDSETAAFLGDQLGLSSLSPVDTEETHEPVQLIFKCSQLLCVVDTFEIDWTEVMNDIQKLVTVSAEQARLARAMDYLFGIDLQRENLIRIVTVLNGQIGCSIRLPVAPSAALALVDSTSSTRRLVGDLDNVAWIASFAEQKPNIATEISANFPLGKQGPPEPPDLKATRGLGFTSQEHRLGKVSEVVHVPTVTQLKYSRRPPGASRKPAEVLRRLVSGFRREVDKSPSARAKLDRPASLDAHSQGEYMEQKIQKGRTSSLHKGIERPSTGSKPGLKTSIEVTSQDEGFESSKPNTGNKSVHFFCDNGSIGIASGPMQVTDLLAPIDGSYHVVLRISSGQLQVIGAAYVEGYLEGRQLGKADRFREQKWRYTNFEDICFRTGSDRIIERQGRDAGGQSMRTFGKVVYNYMMFLRYSEQHVNQTDNYDPPNLKFNDSDTELVIRFNSVDMARFVGEAHGYC